MSGISKPGGYSETPARADTHRPNERHQAILDAVRLHGAASVADLAQRFDVTHQTIRRDLRTLQDRGLLQKGFGGAFAAPGVARHDYDERRGTLTGVKPRLVAALDEFITGGATIFVGLGTTFDSIHEVLLRHPGVLVATPNLEVAYSCALKTDATVYVYGGYVRNKDSAVLTIASDTRQRFKFDLAILGASAIDEEGAILEFDPLEVDLVRAILPDARKKILVAHDGKFRRHAPHQVTHLDNIDILITNGDAARHFTDPALLQNIKVVSTD